MSTKRILLSSPTMHGEEQLYIKLAFEKNWIAPLGFNCDGFEKEVCDYLIKNRGGVNCILFH